MVVGWYALSRQGLKEKNYFSIRYWDGIDRPDYTRLFEITEEETDLRSGRFKNFVHVDFNEKMTFTYVEISSDELTSMFYWLFDNIEFKWSNRPDYVFGDPIIMDFWFEDDIDATAFKLRWL